MHFYYFSVFIGKKFICSTNTGFIADIQFLNPIFVKIITDCFHSAIAMSDIVFPIILIICRSYLGSRRLCCHRPARHCKTCGKQQAKQHARFDYHVFLDNVYNCHLLAKEWAKIAINLCIEGNLKINRLSISMFAIFIVVALTSCAQVGRTLLRM